MEQKKEEKMTKNIGTLLLFSVFLLSPSRAIAQEVQNQIDFGFRGVVFGENSDKARFQRYRDLSNGVTLDFFRLVKDTDNFSMKFRGNHVGYGDQNYIFTYNKFGKMKMSLEYDQIPTFYNDSTRTLYSSSAPGALTINDSIQSKVQAGTLTRLNAVNNNASLFDLESRRKITDFKLEYNSTPNIAYLLTLKNTQVNGSQPWGTSFGFTLANEVPVPLDRRTTDLGAGVELSNNRAYVRLGYDGSFFRNNISVLTWDNPLRISDSATAGPAVAREALWPDTTQNTVSATGGFKLPARSNATAFVSAAKLFNNTPLIPFTSNTALPFIPRDRAMSEISAQILAMNYTFTSRPTNWLYVSTRYKQYTFTNNTEPFKVGQAINYDTALATRNSESEPLSFSRHTLDTDVTWSPFSYVGLRTGFTRESVDRTHRVIEETTENTGRASVDLLSLRGIYEHSVRAGSSMHRDELLSLGQQPSLRQFDISDRNKDRFSLNLVVTPISQFSVNASSGIGKEDYPATDTRTVFGLRSNNNRAHSFGFDFVPVDSISFGASYGYEKYDAFQVSRTANPLPSGGSLTDPAQQFNDPRRDWTIDSADETKTFNMSADFLKLIPKTDIRLGYDDMRSESSYLYGLAPNTVVTAPVQLPAITNRLRQGTIDGRYFATKHVVLIVIYRFDQYDVDDFAFNPRSSLAEPTTGTTQNYMMLGYFQRPYKANTLIGQLSYLW